MLISPSLNDLNDKLIHNHTTHTPPQNFALPTLCPAKASCCAFVGVAGLAPVILLSGLGNSVRSFAVRLPLLALDPGLDPGLNGDCEV